MQIVISDSKTGKAYKLEGKDAEANALFIGKRIGDLVDADIIGLGGYMLEITGGTDMQGMPMRKDVAGSVRKRILITNPPGYNPKEGGKRRRKSVRGKEISAEISQVNVVVKEYGRKSLADIFAPPAAETEGA
jgi:small subunit ribosomal protein S6e